MKSLNTLNSFRNNQNIAWDNGAYSVITIADNQNDTFVKWPQQWTIINL